MAEQTSEYERAEQTAQWLDGRVDRRPDVLMILGSGLGALANEIEHPTDIPYDEIPNFPVSNVEGHAGNLVFGQLEGEDVVVMSGRAHYYEGWTARDVAFPVRAAGLLETDRMIVTNSAGGANPAFEPGDLMVISDHINLMGVNPLRGENDDRFGPRFPDMSNAYSEVLRGATHRAADELDIDLRTGVYTGVMGPSYETPAEIEMIQTLGGDAVGMSTVPETIAANHMGMDVLGISCITNMAAGLQATLDHEEVKETASMVRETFIDLVRGTVSLL